MSALIVSDGNEVVRAMTQILEAVFEDGSFKPVNNGSLPFSE
jgi:hypothetical protein